MTKTSTQTALIYAMVTTSAVDGDMTDAELGTMGRIVDTLPIFEDFAEDDLVATAQACAALLQEEDGLNTVLETIADAVPKRLYETAYAVAVEVASADLMVAPEETRFLQMLRQHLNVERLAAVAIERSAKARYRRS